MLEGILAAKVSTHSLSHVLGHNSHESTVCVSFRLFLIHSIEKSLLMLVRDLILSRPSKESSFKIGSHMYTVLSWSHCMGHRYLLRAAMKMANIDSVFDFMFTSPKEKVSIILYLVIVALL